MKYNGRTTTSEVFSTTEGQTWTGKVTTTFQAEFPTQTDADRFVKTVGTDLNRINETKGVGAETFNSPTITDAFSFNSTSPNEVEWSNQNGNTN
jgi:hypothetical protein